MKSPMMVAIVVAAGLTGAAALSLSPLSLSRPADPSPGAAAGAEPGAVVLPWLGAERRGTGPVVSAAAARRDAARAARRRRTARREREEWIRLTLGSARYHQAAVPVDDLPQRRRERERGWRRIRGDEGTGQGIWGSPWGGLALELEIQTLLFPDSDFAASFREYAEIRGGRYFGYEKRDHATDSKYDPDREIPGFREWIRRYPGHPGRDDACYRLARCLGIVGQRVRALHWFRRAREAPDGDMRLDAAAWTRLLLDALLTDDELLGLALDGDAEAAYSFGVRRFRAGAEEGAEDWIRTALPGLAADVVPEVRDQLRRVREVASLRRAVARAGSRSALAEALYALGRKQYHGGDLYENLLWRGPGTGNRRYALYVRGITRLWGHNGAPDAYRRAWRGMNGRLQARRTFLRLVRDCPDSELVPKARYSATTALAHAASPFPEEAAVACVRERRIEAIREYRAIADEFPGSSLADDALYFAGALAKDPETLRRVILRFPHGDMAAKAEKKLRSTGEPDPVPLDEMPALLARLRPPAGELPWSEWRAAGKLEDALGVCVLRVVKLGGAERGRAVRALEDWFGRVRGMLVFDPAVGAYVLR